MEKNILQTALAEAEYYKKPVEGWTAQESWQTAIHGEKLRSYKVLSCPKYKEDE